MMAISTLTLTFAIKPTLATRLSLFLMAYVPGLIPRAVSFRYRMMSKGKPMGKWKQFTVSIRSRYGAGRA